MSEQVTGLLDYWFTSFTILYLSKKPCDKTECGVDTKNNVALSFNILMLFIPNECCVILQITYQLMLMQIITATFFKTECHQTILIYNIVTCEIICSCSCYLVNIGSQIIVVFSLDLYKKNQQLGLCAKLSIRLTCKTIAGINHFRSFLTSLTKVIIPFSIDTGN